MSTKLGELLRTFEMCSDLIDNDKFNSNQKLVLILQLIYDSEKADKESIKMLFDLGLKYYCKKEEL